MPSTSTLRDIPLWHESVVAELHQELIEWYRLAARPLPWREPDCTPWGVMVSEIMAQQTPVARVEPYWRQWMRRWPEPAALAAEPAGEAVRAWGRLGYPRRALRLHEAAGEIVTRFDGVVPRSEADLLSLPGVGAYTAAAIAAFAYGQRTVVVDTNVRRVQARLARGVAQASPSLSRAEVRLALALLPATDARAAVWNVAVMELGALVCTSRAPACSDCPVSTRCRWLAAGQPAYAGPPRRSQAWEGTDRQVRGQILAQLRHTSGPVPEAAFHGIEPVQRARCLGSLVADGLITPSPPAAYSLPS